MDPSAIRFVLNGRPVAVAGVDPQTSLLTWLREEARLTGTKEGCAEGDCGACTVVLGEADGAGGVRLAPINACICLLPSVDGKAVFTVEGLERADGSLHPVQRSLADCHGSQCGFCTPGFVMSLFALYKNSPGATRQQAIEALSGNLCRCTGYRPIIEASQAMQEATVATPAQGAPLPDWLAEKAVVAPGDRHPGDRHPGERLLAAELAGLARSEDFSYSAAGVTFHAPRSVESMSALFARHPEAWILAGGTDVGLWINKLLLTTSTIIYTGQVAGLADIAMTDAGIAIGAAATLEDAFKALNDHYPEFGHVWLRFASLPIRSAGTLGGNVANGSPIGDAMPLLIALSAEVELAHGAARRSLALEDLYLDYRKQARRPGEWVLRVIVPPRRAAVDVAAYKNSKRNEQDISAVCLGIALERDRGRVRKVRIAYGGMAGVPKRARAAEQALIGRNWDEGAVRDAMQALTQDFTPLSDMRATAAYRMKVAQNLLMRAFLEVGDPALETRVY
ncbi:MAG: xanthine dehydrogenase small subunit [Burkholderiales bacterium]